MGLHKFWFTVSDTLVGVDANTLGSCTLYKYANKEAFYLKHFENYYLRLLWEKYIIHL